MYNPKAIANYFIRLANKAGCRDLSPMKLQKLVYFAHGWSLGLTGKPLINEQVEAWKFGPVVPSIFHAAKDYGMNNIDKPLLESDFDTETYEFIYNTPEIDLNDNDTKEILDFVWDIYGELNAYQLSNITHQAGTPWDTVANRYRENIPQHTDIDTDTIKSWFEAEAVRLSQGAAK